MLVAGTAAEVTPLAELAEVAWIENFTFREKHNEYGAGVISGTAAANANGYDGSSQTVAVADTGLGDGTQAGAHTDIPSSRITAINDWPGANIPTAPRSPTTARRTSTPATAPTPRFRRWATATAPGWARAAPPAPTWCSSRSRTSPPSSGRAGFARTATSCPGSPTAYDLFDRPTTPARASTPTRGGRTSPATTPLDSANADELHLGLPADMPSPSRRATPGIDANANGVVDNDSIGAPATAKNVLTVGA